MRARANLVILGLTVLAARPASAWTEDRLTLLPLVVEGNAATELETMTQVLIESVAVKELSRASGLCVVAPKDLRTVERDPKNAPTICGLPAPEALGTRNVVHVAIGKPASGWRLVVRWIDRRESEILVKVEVTRPNLGELLEELPELFVAVAEAAARYPRAKGRLLGVLAVDEAAACPGFGQQPVDAEATVEWPEPVPWLAKEYGPVRLARARQTRAVEVARRQAVEEAVRGAFTWLLAQQSKPARQVIHDNAIAFDTWAKRHVTDFAFADWVAKEEVLEERVESDQRAARSMVRACVEVSRMRAAINRRVSLLDPARKPTVVVISDNATLAAALAAFCQSFHYRPGAVEVVGAMPNPDYKKGRAYIQQTLRQAGATVAILGRAELRDLQTTPETPVEVEIGLNAVAANGLSQAVATWRERPPHANRQVAVGRVTANWPRVAQPAFEDFLLRLRSPVEPP